MAYRENVTDKQQSDIEAYYSNSGQRLQWFNGQKGQEGQTKVIPAYDLAQSTAPERPSPNDVQAEAGNRARLIIGNHNDKPARFSQPGKA